MSSIPESHRLAAMSALTSRDAKDQIEIFTSTADKATLGPTDATTFYSVALPGDADELGDLGVADAEAQTRLAKLYKDYGVSFLLCDKGEEIDKKRRQNSLVLLRL